MLVNILSVFRFAHGGIRVVEYRPGTAVDLLAEVAECAIAEGWAEPYATPVAPVEIKSKDTESPGSSRRGRRK